MARSVYIKDFHAVAVGRELKMKKMEEEMEGLKKRLVGKEIMKKTRR